MSAGPQRSSLLRSLLAFGCALLALAACSGEQPAAGGGRTPQTAQPQGKMPASMGGNDAEDDFTNPAAMSGQGGASGSSAMPTAEPAAAGVLKGGCATASVQARLIPSNLLFVIDRSGSMNCNPPPLTESAACEADPERADPAMPSKWEITKDALNAALQLLPPSTSAGISYFSNDDSCGVSSSPSVELAPIDATQLANLSTSLDAVTPSGGTPLVGATVLAYKHLHQLALQQRISGNSFVVLLTDGQQSEPCSDPMRCATASECTDLLVEQEVPKAASPGADIRTFVIGAPGSEPARVVLSRMAEEGGTALQGCDAQAGDCHFDMSRESDFASALAQALTAISGRAASCELPLPAPEGDAGSVDLERVNVVYTPGDGSPARVIPQDLRAACDAGAEGWQPSEDMLRIELCGTICEAVRADLAAHLDVVLGCPVQGPL